MYKIHVETGNPKYFCCICQNEKTNEYFLSKCNHKWCIDCHGKLTETSKLCPLCREEFAKPDKPDKPDTTKKIAFYSAMIISTLLCLIILLLGRLYYILLFDYGNNNIFENNMLIIPTTIFGTILLSISFILFFLLFKLSYKICKKRFNFA